MNLKDKITLKQELTNFLQWRLLHEEYELLDVFHQVEIYMKEYHTPVKNNGVLSDVSKRSEPLFAFIKEWKEEFKDENWDYLDFVAERVLSKQQQRLE